MTRNLIGEFNRYFLSKCYVIVPIEVCMPVCVPFEISVCLVKSAHAHTHEEEEEEEAEEEEEEEDDEEEKKKKPD